MKLLITILLIGIISGCDFSGQDGPDGSWLVGDSEKGVYVFIEENGNAADRTYQGVIYSASNEAVLYRGKLDYSLHTPVDYKNRSIYDRWDGERLYLKDNSFLKAIDKK